MSELFTAAFYFTIVIGVNTLIYIIVAKDLLIRNDEYYADTGTVDYKAIVIMMVYVIVVNIAVIGTLYNHGAELISIVISRWS